MGAKETGCISSLWLWLWFLLATQPAVAATVYWTAKVEIKYTSPAGNQTVQRSCECGVFGYNSPLAEASGQAALPIQDPLACAKDTSFSNESEPWVALIERGNCTFTEKVQRAARQGASAVLIYNLKGTGNETSPMYLEGFCMQLPHVYHNEAAQHI
ncbi:hypothetical protein JZ751_025459 [Albula glossodonta]|uniref:PA domain-containing protein n=1 Tax=Albula glossodonta TaxID=121402 RepID=A0A8T2NI48_9TELE|nr:hypothetical protein JZ751_025459 [Albula glossodonta]